ncbi:hypothetical protein F2H75_16990 [Salmonella enterica]|nr:hypothetical protein [Salmonella enterica]
MTILKTLFRHIDSTKEFLKVQNCTFKSKAGRYGGTWICEELVYAYAYFPVRTVTIDNEPWFVAKDVCDAIGVSNNRQALTALDDNEKNTVSLNDGNRGNPNTLVISEGGMYTLVLRCRQATTELIEKYQIREIPVITSTRGRNGDTWVIEELLYAYASWISPQFHKAVLDAFTAAVSGDMVKVREFMRRVKTRKLINSLQSTTQICVVKSEEGGNHSGTYVHPDIALAYAAAVDNDFYVNVAKTFGNVVRGDIEAAIEEASRAVLHKESKENDEGRDLSL